MTPTETNPGWMTVPEVANRWRCSRDTVLRMIKAEKLKAMPLGGGYRVHMSEVVRYEAGDITSPPPETRKRKSRPPKLPMNQPDCVGDLSSVE